MSFQPSLFELPEKEVIALPDADLIYMPAWLQSLDNREAYANLHQELKTHVPWEQSDLQLYGKTVTIPRVNAWYGDPGCGYIYSGTYFPPLPWLPVLLALKQQVEAALGEYLQQPFNSALVNCYRDGQDSVAWHSDDEPELGLNPLVASLSLGAERVFQLRHKKGTVGSKFQMALNDGDLLLMAGTTQRYWLHQIPKTTAIVGERISITFRRICLT